MPNYDWKCRKCGMTFEKVAPSNVTAVVCPKCDAFETDYKATVWADRQPSGPAFKVQGGTPRFHK